MYFTLKSYGKILINKHCNLKCCLCQTLGKNIFQDFLVCLKLKIFAKQEMVKFLPCPKQLKLFQAKLQHKLLDVGGDSCQQKKFGGPLALGLHKDLSSLPQFAR